MRPTSAIDDLVLEVFECEAEDILIEEDEAAELVAMRRRELDELSRVLATYTAEQRRELFRRYCPACGGFFMPGHSC